MVAPMKVAVAGVCVFLFGYFFGYYGFPALLNSKIAENVALKKGSDMRKAWSKFPVAVEFKIYLMNITNPLEVQSGAKPVIQEVGPYFYDEWKEKVHLADDRHEDTVSFNQKTTWLFNANKSGSLDTSETITMAHPAMLSLVMAVAQSKPAMLTVINRALGGLYNGPTSIFLTATAKEILFEGVVINCTSKEFAVQAICTQLRQNADALHRVSNEIFKFSFFGVKNGTVEKGRFTVKRGMQNHKDVGRVVAFNGKPQMSFWAGPECNAIRGTDSSIFPPFLTPEDEIVSYAPDLCRSLGAKYQGPLVYRGIPGYHYTATLGDMNNPAEKCYCTTPTTCLKKGTFDLTRCTGAPIILTLPHFYETDPSYMEGVVGLRPSKEEHQIYLNFEPMTGTPLGGRKRLQFNIMIRSLKKVDLMKQLPTALVPMMWVEEGLELEQKFIDILESSLFRTIRIVGVVKWVVMVLGLALVVLAVLLAVKRVDMRKSQPPAEKAKEPSRASSKVQVATIEGEF